MVRPPASPALPGTCRHRHACVGASEAERRGGSGRVLQQPRAWATGGVVASVESWLMATGWLLADPIRLAAEPAREGQTGQVVHHVHPETPREGGSRATRCNHSDLASNSA